MSVAIRAEGLSKTYSIRVPQADGQLKRVDKLALQDVSFEVSEGDVLGIIGRNGSGKSTLLKILARVTTPTKGHAVVHGSVASLLEVGTGMHPEMTGRENIFLNGALLGMSRPDIAARFDEVVEFAEVSEYIDTPIKHYSSGMKLRLAFAVAAHLSADVMVVDEVLAVGDAAFQKKCLGTLREGMRRGRTTLFVSHHLPSVENLCNRALLLSEGRVVQAGETADVVRAYLRGELSADVGTSNPVNIDETPRGWVTEKGHLQELHFLRPSVAGEAPWVVAFGEPWALRFSFRLSPEAVEVIAGIGIRSDTGQEVFTTHSSDAEIIFEGSERGEQAVTVDMSSAYLLPGRYNIEVALISGGTLIDHTPDCASVLVEERAWPHSPLLALKKGLTAPVLPWKAETLCPAL
jgi:lipopolysaccharide transport system ATP-binding protein